MIPSTSSWIPRLLDEFHNSPQDGHSGAMRTYKRIAASIYWQGMMKKVKDYVATCLTCQRNKYETMLPKGLLRPLPIPNQMWEKISMDFIIWLPKSKRVDCILVVVDRLSKYVHFL